MGHVYINYYAKDKNFTDNIVSGLREAGVNVWRDIDEIAPGQDWASQIQQALEDAEVMLIIASQYTALTDYVTGDFAVARRQAIPLIFLVFDTAGAKLVSKLNIKAEMIDFREGYEAAFRRLIRLMPASVKQPQPIQQEISRSKGYVFISYAEEDTDFVETLRAFLKGKGYGYWDYQDSDRNYHTQLFLELEEVIRGAAATISVLSPAWKQSQWAAKEYLFSEEVATPVFLVMARDMGPTLVTAGIAYIDFASDEANGFKRLDHALRRKGLI